MYGAMYISGGITVCRGVTIAITADCHIAMRFVQFSKSFGEVYKSFDDLKVDIGGKFHILEILYLLKYDQSYKKLKIGTLKLSGLILLNNI